MFSELFQAFKNAGLMEIIVSILLMVGLIAIIGLLIGLSMIAYFKRGKWAMLVGFAITIIVSLYPEQFSDALFYSTMIIIGIPVALLLGFVHWISK